MTEKKEVKEKPKPKVTEYVFRWPCRINERDYPFAFVRDVAALDSFTRKGLEELGVDVDALVQQGIVYKKETK